MQYAAQFASVVSSRFRLTEQIEHPAAFTRLQTVDAEHGAYIIGVDG